MPPVGFQHDVSGTKAPPVNESESGFSQVERTRLASVLQQYLGPEFIARRDGPGGQRMSYLEGWKAVNLANEIFGFDGWNMNVREYTLDFCDLSESTGRISLGLSAVVRITLKDGTFREDVGYGHCENQRYKHQAYEKAKKEATTDAMKRTLRLFGSVLGGCLSDKSFIQLMARHKPNEKVSDPRYEDEQLFRAPGYGGKKSTIPGTHSRPVTSSVPSPISIAPEHSTDMMGKSEPAKQEVPIKLLNEEDYFFSDEDDLDLDMVDSAINRQAQNVSEQKPQELTDNKTPAPEEPEDMVTKQELAAELPMELPTELPTFVSARAATAVLENSPLPPNSQFDPTFQSPSIRRTLNHNKSVPVKRAEIDGTGIENLGSRLGSPRVPPHPPSAGRVKRGPSDLGPNATNIMPADKRPKAV